MLVEGLTLSPRLECSGAMMVHCSLDLLGLNNPPTSASQSAGITGIMNCHTWSEDTSVSEVKYNIIGAVVERIANKRHRSLTKGSIVAYSENPVLNELIHLKRSWERTSS
ncbi:Protein PPP5D1 [Plecturocebus cupreus]